MQKEGLEKLLRRTDFDEWSADDNDDGVCSVTQNAGVQVKEECVRVLTINPMIVFKTVFVQ